MLTAEELRGRRITVGIAWLAGAPPVIVICVLALMGRAIPPAAWISRAAVPIALSWMLVHGRRWVRTIAVVGFALDSVGALGQLILTNWTLTTMLELSIVAATHGIAAAALVASPAAKSFFRYQNRVLDLGLRGA